jgi:hypothetical protein
MADRHTSRPQPTSTILPPERRKLWKEDEDSNCCRHYEVLELLGMHANKLLRFVSVLTTRVRPTKRRRNDAYVLGRVHTIRAIF